MLSTRKVDELVESLGMKGISKSEVSRICKDLDEVVLAFKERPLEGQFPYVWLDATARRCAKAACTKWHWLCHWGSGNRKQRSLVLTLG